jgi:hypothetical protein
MKQLHNAQDAIQQAIEGGYTPHTHITNATGRRLTTIYPTLFSGKH